MGVIKLHYPSHGDVLSWMQYDDSVDALLRFDTESEHIRSTIKPKKAIKGTHLNQPFVRAVLACYTFSPVSR